ncbi:sugar phosphate nucleotidyltransferase [Alphaproteobacteria bacterium]|nr:sugar phosphate nucleotidyltransferase [Alphaproteobacteria bacterium]
MSKRAVVLAGGLGTRLKPYTVALPKPLMPVGDYSILEIIIRQLAMTGFTRITLAVNHQANIIAAVFGDGKKWGVDIDYSLETTRLGTMGPIKIIDNLPENFLVLNGDVLTDLNFGKFYNYHVAEKNLFTISSFERKQKIDYGVLEIEGNKLNGFREKPEFALEVSMGVYMVSRRVVDLIPPEVNFGFDQLMKLLINKKKLVDVIKHQGYWFDIGRHEEFSDAVDFFEANANKFLESGEC